MLVAHTLFRRNEMLKLKPINEISSDDKKALRVIKQTILNDPKVKYLTSKVFKDDGAWGTFKSLIEAIKNSHLFINNVYYEDDQSYGPNGYLWDHGKMVTKSRIVTITTDFGELKGRAICFAAGTVEDPLSSYDMTLQLF